MSNFKKETLDNSPSGYNSESLSEEELIAPICQPKIEEPLSKALNVVNRSARSMINKIKCKKSKRSKEIIKVEDESIKKEEPKTNAAPSEPNSNSISSKSSESSSSEPQDFPPAAPTQSVQISKLYIGNLPLVLSQHQLEKLFKKYGNLTEVQLIINSTTGKSKGFGFVTYTDMESAMKAKNELNMQILDGNKISVEFWEGE